MKKQKPPRQVYGFKKTVEKIIRIQKTDGRISLPEIRKDPKLLKSIMYHGERKDQLICIINFRAAVNNILEKSNKTQETITFRTINPL